MTIYVRTQDKTKMFEISSVSYEEKRRTTKNVYDDTVTSETIEVRHILKGDGKLLGEYITKVRALEIMTEIQKKIVKDGTTSTIMYDMPES